MKPGLAKIIEKVHISRYYESPETNLHIAENAGCITYADTWSSKLVDSLSNGPRPHCGTPYYGCEDTMELNTGVAWASIPITRIHLQLAPQSNIHQFPATLHNTGWMDHCYVRYRSIEAIAILDFVDFDYAYRHIASRYLTLQWHVQMYGWCNASYG